ncbi:hypothetical protein ACLOJK_025676 [Asimina triloba]
MGIGPLPRVVDGFKEPTEKMKPAAPNRQLCASSEAVETVDVHAANGLIGSGHRYLDVRTAEEFKKGHLESALNVPYMFITPDGTHNPPCSMYISASVSSITICLSIKFLMLAFFILEFSDRVKNPHFLEQKQLDYFKMNSKLGNDPVGLASREQP